MNAPRQPEQHDPSGPLPGARPEPLWRPHAVVLIGQLVRAGVLTDGAWRDALLDIPRHHFIPEYLTPDPTGGPRWQRYHRPDDPAAEPAWLATLYRSAPLTVALSGIAMWGRRHPVAVSPDPELTVRALQALDIRATDHVLELGTGTAHTTALLAHRVGAEQVATVEIDAELHLLARDRLTTLGLRPHQVLTDSSTLSPPTGDAQLSGRVGGFDRILAGHSIDHIPATWLHHAAPDALLLVTLTGGLGAGRPALLHRQHSAQYATGHTATGGRVLHGRFLPWAWPLPPQRRTARLLAAPSRPEVAATAHHQPTATDPATLHDNSTLTLLHQLHLLPGTTAAVRHNDSGHAATYLHAPDGSWAEIPHHNDHDGRRGARLCGPTNLLTALHTARAHHYDLHQPSWTDFGITAAATATGKASTTVWHGHPDTDTSWTVHPAPAGALS